MTEHTQNEEAGGARETIMFHYLKGPAFRTLFAHGAVVSGTSRGEVVLTPYVERVPIPTQAEYEFSEVSEKDNVKRGRVGRQVNQVCREGLIRELDISFILPPAIAEQIANLLLEKAREIRETTSGWDKT